MGKKGEQRCQTIDRPSAARDALNLLRRKQSKRFPGLIEQREDESSVRIPRNFG